MTVPLFKVMVSWIRSILNGPMLRLLLLLPPLLLLLPPLPLLVRKF